MVMFFSSFRWCVKCDRVKKQSARKNEKNVGRTSKKEKEGKKLITVKTQTVRLNWHAETA